MKKNSILSLLSFFLLGFAAFSQKGIKVDIKSVNKVIKFPPILKELEKTDLYKFELPGRLTYHSAAEIKGFFPYELNGIGIKAKYRENEATYIFEVQSSGISNIKELPARYYENVNSLPMVRGYYKDIQYNFPCSLIVKIWDGKEIKVLRKVEINSKDEVFTGVLDAGNSAPFPNQEAANNAFVSNKANFYKATERGAMRSAYYRFTLVIDYLFAEYNHGKTPVSIGFVKTKNREFDFTDIDSLTEKYKQAIDVYYEGTDPRANELLASVSAEYEKLLSSTEAKIDNNVKDMAKLNLGYCNTLLGNFGKARENIAVLKKSPAVGYYAAKELENFISLYNFRKTVAEQ
jgi:hypothetical protein